MRGIWERFLPSVEMTIRFPGAADFQPRHPLDEEVAHFVREVPPTPRANSVNDVYVDEHRIGYAVDRLKGGLYILELTI